MAFLTSSPIQAADLQYRLAMVHRQPLEYGIYVHNNRAVSDIWDISIWDKEVEQNYYVYIYTVTYDPYSPVQALTTLTGFRNKNTFLCFQMCVL